MQASVPQSFSETRVNRAYEFADLSDYSFKDRLLIRAADLVFYVLINLIGLTARFEVVGWENHDKAEENGGLPIYVFWHDRIFLTTYWWRKRRSVVMTRLMRSGCTTAFTIDGPRGPRYVAKMGAVLLAKKSGHPIVPVTMAVDGYWTTPSWDLFQIPKPFTRARVYVAAPIYVPPDADDEVLAAKRDELQQTLDDLNHQSEEWRRSLRSKSV